MAPIICSAITENVGGVFFIRRLQISFLVGRHLKLGDRSGALPTPQNFRVSWASEATYDTERENGTPH